MASQYSLILPPKSPQLNGAVERNQGVWRYAFYASFDLPHRIDKPQTFVDAFACCFDLHRRHLKTFSSGVPRLI